MTDSDLIWFNSYFHAMCIRKTGDEWQRFVTDAMFARHGEDFIQVDPSFRGDKGCDGYVDGLMLACYGASRPTIAGVKTKIETDLFKAKGSWSNLMTRWAFVHNNATGLPAAAAQAIAVLKPVEAVNGLSVESWPPQILWKETLKGLDRAELVTLIGVPPSQLPAQMTYIADAVRSISRTRLVPHDEPTLPVPQKKIEFNRFEPATAALIRSFQVFTHSVRYYFQQGPPGEQFQVREHLRNRYDALVATLGSPDAVFHALCDELMQDAFVQTPSANIEQRRNAAVLVVTHFFESCMIFEMPEEDPYVSSF
jgi:hypothetical protein